MLKTKKDVLNYLDSFINYEINRNVPYIYYNLSFIDNFLEYLKHPENKFKIIHIAGTNGKGSLSLILSHILSSKNIITGTYISPHIANFNERIQINNMPINDDNLVSLCNEFINIFKNIIIKPSYFDVILSIAILAFNKSNCEYVVLETGMGGRLDSTNFCNSVLSIISTVALDHTRQLGDTISQIAIEKAGIIKEDTKVIIGKQKMSIYSIFKTIAKEKRAKYYQYNEDFSIKNLEINDKGISFQCIISDSPQDKMLIELPLLSIYQSINVSIILFALKILKIPFTEEEINKILNKIHLLGRFHQINVNPSVILDGAHNEHAIKSLLVNLKLRYKKTYKKILIIGIIKDKDFKRMLELICPFFDEIIITKLSFNLKNDISLEIFEIAKKLSSSVKYSNNFAEAYKIAEKTLQKNDLLLITGSFYLVGEALNYFC